MAVITAGNSGPIGFGLMGFTWRENPTPTEESIEVMKRALELGANFWNGGEIYGKPEANSLHLLNAYFTKYPEDADKVILSIKGAANPGTLVPRGDKEGLTRSIEECLRVLDGKKKIDIFESARVDPKVPIEETIGHLAEFVKAGKIGGIGLSEVGAATIRRAAAVHPIAAVEVEFSLFTRDILTNGVAAACAELNTPIVAYSPLGRGFLTGQIKGPEDVTQRHKMSPRFHDEHLQANLNLAKAIRGVAEERGCTPAQLAIGWAMKHSQVKGCPIIIPIPGTTTEKRLEENLKQVELSQEDMQKLDRILADMPVAGPRAPEFHAHLEWA